MWMPSWSKTAPPPTPTIVTLLICFSSILSAAVEQLLPETLLVLPWLMVPSTWMTIGVELLARLHRAWWMAVPVVARTVCPPAPPVVPPFWDAYPVAPLAAADAVVADADSTAPVAAARAKVAVAAESRIATGRLILASLVVVTWRRSPRMPGVWGAECGVLARGPVRASSVFCGTPRFPAPQRVVGADGAGSYMV
jgi:hypothetical protein